MDDVYGRERSLAYDVLPPYSPVRRYGSNDFLNEERDVKDDGIVVRIARAWTRTAAFNETPKKIVRTTSNLWQKRTWPAIRDTTTTHVAPVISSSTRRTWDFIVNHTWQAIRDYPLKASQFWGLLLLLLGIVPFVAYGLMMRDGTRHAFYYGAFAAKTLGCGDALGVPQNATVKGIESLFILDLTFGRFSFSRVKTIDVAFDIIIGRGVQGILWAICYRIFTDALLRLIERHPVSFETFKSISLEGAGLGSSWVLTKQLFRNRSKRTWFLFVYLLLSSFYVLSIPPLLGAMTGYDGTSIAWVSIGGDNIIPSSQLDLSYVVYGQKGKPFDEPLCDDTITELRDWYYHQMDVQKYCDCQLPNKTVLPYNDWQYYYSSLTYGYRADETNYKLEDCKLNFPNNSKLYNSTWGQDSNYNPAMQWKTYNCNDTFPVTLPNNKTYSMYDLDFSSNQYCFQNKSLNYMELIDSTRCLPDTANPSYQWGFSSALMGVLIIINLVWCLTMWLVWQDALRAKMVRDGYRMSPLRAAFVLTEAARRTTGIGGEGLVLKDRRTLKRKLERRKGHPEASVHREIFEEMPAEVEVDFATKNATRIKRRPVSGRVIEDFGDV
ncbi:hypothetical protein BU23DRAFT_553279 [Bimuria novae-zelandiae CBS 107.79]|uniref:Uncharacterized protein n=1 Tax=Bimuria novae-zelandiae CBS 107.79 TaxID=1447943 RepID=A0A6A5VBU9_9PLEO|nr:hypothetical protein BU23DRAFT_553279 [Bimuria novae-zelandiae CBS 107.79]